MWFQIIFQARIKISGIKFSFHIDEGPDFLQALVKFENSTSEYRRETAALLKHLFSAIVSYQKDLQTISDKFLYASEYDEGLIVSFYIDANELDNRLLSVCNDGHLKDLLQNILDSLPNANGIEISDVHWWVLYI